jgi:hypothetical protein
MNESNDSAPYRLSDDQRTAVRRGLAEMCEGKLASNEAVAAVFNRYRDERKPKVGQSAACPPSISAHEAIWWARFALPTLQTGGSESQQPGISEDSALGGQLPTTVIASAAKQSIAPRRKYGLLRRYAPRNDG